MVKKVQELMMKVSLVSSFENCFSFSKKMRIRKICLVPFFFIFFLKKRIQLEQENTVPTRVCLVPVFENCY